MDLFGFVEGVAAGWVGAGDSLHLHHHPLSSVSDDEIDFSPTDPHVALFDRYFAPGEESLSKLFTGRPDAASCQIWVPGSSSSMLTSRKLRTRTFWRKRAGRYMSHTQASSISISKYTDPSAERSRRSTLLAR